MFYTCFTIKSRILLWGPGENSSFYCAMTVAKFQILKRVTRQKKRERNLISHFQKDLQTKTHIHLFFTLIFPSLSDFLGKTEIYFFDRRTYKLSVHSYLEEIHLFNYQLCIARKMFHMIFLIFCLTWIGRQYWSASITLHR